MIPENAQTKQFENLPHFLGLLRSISPGNWIYRGEASMSWILRPKAGRDEFHRELDRVNDLDYPQLGDDLRFFERWRHDAIAYDRKLPKNTLECLAYAQHYGLATRLLDWSRNPLVALFFAVDSHDDDDAVVYCYLVTGHRPLDPKNDFLGEVGVRLYIPRPFDRRILAQQGLFTYHSHPRKEFPARREDATPIFPTDSGVTSFSDLVGITIPGKYKYHLRRELRDMGVTRNALFPDLEGLSSFINREANEEVRGIKAFLAQQQRNTERGPA